MRGVNREKTVWYLHPKDPATNECLAKIIGEQNPECERRDVLCADGVRRDLWVCPKGPDTVQAARAAIQKFYLKFETFKEEIEDVILRYRLQEPEVRRRAAHTRSLNAKMRRCGKHRIS